jgi:phosphatidylserine synthase
MLDPAARRLLDRPLTAMAARLARHRWLTPDRLTLAGLALGLTSAGTAAARQWTAALICWLLSRLADGLDGPLARHHTRTRARQGVGTADANAPATGTGAGRDRSTGQAGGFLDISADFVVYGTTAVGVAVGAGGSPWPFMAVLLAYYLNGSAFLAFSSIAERTGRTIDDGRSLSFLGGLAEGTETVIVHSVWCLLPALAGRIATGWAVLVGVSAAHRIWAGYHALRSPAGPRF